MKNATLSLVATLMFFFVASSLSAQIIATWQGGAPGRSTDWNCAKNWKEGRVPNEFSAVVIPDVSTGTAAWPVIKTSVEVNSLFCAPSAQITISESAHLIILLPVDEAHPLADQDSLVAIGSPFGHFVFPKK